MRLFHQNFVNFKELDNLDLSKPRQLGLVQNKYAGHPIMIWKQIASHLRYKNEKKVQYTTIQKIVGGNANTIGVWRKSNYFASLWTIRTSELQTNQWFGAPRNTKLELALKLHVLTCNDTGFTTGYVSFRAEAINLDLRLRIQAT